MNLTIEEKIQPLSERVIKDVEGMPWGDTLIPKQQLRESVKYFIRAYTNDVNELIKKEENCEEKTNPITRTPS